MGKRSALLLAPTTGSVSWSVFDDERVDDKFDCQRISLILGAAPSSAGLINIYLDSADGSDYDSLLRSENPVGKQEIVFEDINGIDYGSKLLVEYANPDGVSVSGEATIAIYGNKK